MSSESEFSKEIRLLCMELSSGNVGGAEFLLRVTKLPFPNQKLVPEDMKDIAKELRGYLYHTERAARHEKETLTTSKINPLFRHYEESYCASTYLKRLLSCLVDYYNRCPKKPLNLEEL